MCLQLNSCWNKDKLKIKQTAPRHSALHMLCPPPPSDGVRRAPPCLAALQGPGPGGCREKVRTSLGRCCDTKAEEQSPPSTGSKDILETRFGIKEEPARGRVCKPRQNASCALKANGHPQPQTDVITVSHDLYLSDLPKCRLNIVIDSRKLPT